MTEDTLSVVSYWRNSLADAELGRGGWHDQDLSSATIRPRPELISAKLDSDGVSSFFKSEPLDVELIEVALYPLMFKLRTEHGSKKQYALPLIITPVVIKAVMNRKGLVVPLPKIFLARDLLEPLERGSFSIGSIDDLDTFLTHNPCPIPRDILEQAGVIPTPGVQSESVSGIPPEIWRETLTYCDQMLDHVCKDDRLKESGYLRAREWMVRKLGQGDTPSRRASSLYDHIEQVKPDTPLLDNFAGINTLPTEPLLPGNYSLASHSGHYSDQFPLATAQRDAINHAMAMADGEILAVNGPPGTGKTALLLSIVASHWVNGALKGEKPPVIVATSTNNQAVTNIIDAFQREISHGMGPMSGRWISDIDSYGLYLASKARQQQNGSKYLVLDDLEALEKTERIDQARSEFLERAKQAFPDLTTPTVQDVVDRLHHELQSEHSVLERVRSTHTEAEHLRVLVKKSLGEDHITGLHRMKTELENAQKSCKMFEQAHFQLAQHLQEQPFWYDLLKFIPSVSRQQSVRASVVVRRTIKNIPADRIWQDPEALCEALQTKITHLKAVSKKLQTRKGRALSLLKKAKEASLAHKDSIEGLGKRVETHLAGRDDELPKKPENIFQANLFADTSIRFGLLQLATHYWEGRWLLDVEDEFQRLKEQGCNLPETISRKWRRRMMLTPCAVSTLFMLPGELRALIDNNKRKHTYLYNFVDLLIIDEGGQVIPEIAGASFALAKKAVVIGDTAQIEPIWNVPSTVDIGNLIHHQIIKGDADSATLEHIKASGIMASSGNVMLVAQQRSRYHYDTDLARGMYLYEHRRCFNEIIAFCNALSYKHKLIPVRGRCKDLPEPPNPFPPLAYVHVLGECRVRATGTRYNTREAETIAAWLKAYKEQLESLYGGRRIEDLVGIITPFAGQVEVIRASCKEAGIDVSVETGITIGTVHSLQGAERQIVLFSSTYTKESNGAFIDASPSMLNVAVSRAKDNFIVFGDMRTFNPKLGYTPRGLLAGFLFRSDESQLDFKIN